MAYLALLWKARTIEKCRLKYEQEKINSINSKRELRSTLYEKWTVYRNDSQKKLEQIYRKLCPEGSRLAHSCTFLREHSSFLFKIVIGFVGGILTYFLLSFWTVLGWPVGVAITLGVSFSYTVRCLVLLLIPGLFSRVGRYTLACYALVLILTGPAANTLKNLDTLSASLACGQEQIKSSVKEIKESKDSPVNLVKETISLTVEKVEYLAAKMKIMMVRIHRLTMSIAHVLQSSLSWLNSVELSCNERLGTPYDHCVKILAQGTEDCQKIPEFQRQWKWNHLMQAVCLNLKLEEPLCVVGDFAKGSIVATVKKKLSTYSTGVQSLLAMGVHVHRSHSCCNGIAPVKQAAAGLITDLRNRADTLLAWLSWTCALTLLFLMLIIFRAKYYLHMFRTRSRFDNRYVTKELRELDLKRQRQGRETVLPLNTRERAKYVSTSSIRLLPSERMYLTRSIVFMVITTLKLMIHMVADYSLYWVLMNVRFHGRKDDFQPSNRTERIFVSGSGPLSATVRLLMDALSVPLILSAPSTAACLPDPKPPDFRRYKQIGTLILLLWLLALFEPYGLRLRHVISGHYQPERAKARAVWLYYHIIRTRSCFLKYARRKLHRQFKYTTEEKFTFKNWLNSCIPCQWLRTLLRVGPAELYCLLCYTKHRQEDIDRHLKRCETPSCPGVYCARCFMDMGQLCTICYAPEDYGDLSDVSLEKFNSDDDRSDDSDDCGDDNIPLMGTRDYEIKDTNGVPSHRNKKNMSSKFLESNIRHDNQESTPLLDCDYLEKDYTERGIIELKNDKTFDLNKLEEVSQTKNQAKYKVSEIFVKDGKGIHTFIQRNKGKPSPSDERKRTPMVFKDTEVSVNGITFPKGKLSAIINVMMILTAKEENCDKHKGNVTTKHKPFEYLVMEMFQPLGIFQRISLGKPFKCTSSQRDLKTKKNEPFKNRVRFLFENSGIANTLYSTETLQNTGVQTDFNFNNSEPILKYVQDTKERKEEILTKLTKNVWSARRNVKRFLDVKKYIISSLIETSKSFRLNCDKQMFSCKKRRRRNKNYIGLALISKFNKVFCNKAVDNMTDVPHALSKHVEENKVQDKIETSLKKIKQASLQTRDFVSPLKSARDENECCIINHLPHLSTTAKSANENNDECGFDESNAVIADHKTMTAQTNRQTKKKLGFFKIHRLRRRRTRKNEPSFYNFFTIYKRRNKSRFNKKENAYLETSNPIGGAQSSKESRSLEEEESRRIRRIPLDDDKNNECASTRNMSNLSKKLKTLSQMALNFPKKNKLPRPVAFSNGLELKVSDTDCNRERPVIQIESNNELENKPSCRLPNVVPDVKNDTIDSEDEVETMQSNKYLAGTIDDVESDQSTEITRHYSAKVQIQNSDEVTLEYADEKTPKSKRNRVNATETTNSSTATVTMTIADDSTTTSDWWSPMFERKNHNSSVNIYPARWRPVITEEQLEQAHALKYYKRRNLKNKKKNHKSSEVKQKKESEQNSLVAISNMWTTSIYSSYYVTYIKK